MIVNRSALAQRSGAMISTDPGFLAAPEAGGHTAKLLDAAADWCLDPDSGRKL